MNHRWHRIAAGVTCSIAAVLAFASIAQAPSRAERSVLRMDPELAAVPAARPPRPEPPSVEQPEALADYYFVRFPELVAPPEVIRRLARYYCVERPDLDMPGRMLDVVVDYYRLQRPDLRPPSGLQDRLQTHGRAVVRPATETPLDSHETSAPDEPVAATEEAIVQAPEPIAPTEAAATASVPANAEPAVVIRRDRESVAEGEPMLLKAGLSFEMTSEQLSERLLARFQQADSEVEAIPGQAGTLRADWRGVTEISAQISHCPDFVTCLAFQERMKLRTDLMEWNWALSLNSSSVEVPESFLTAIEFRAYRGNLAQDKTGTVVQALPPMRLKFHRVCDGECVKGRIRWVAETLGEGENAFARLRDLLIAIAACVTLIAGWLGWKKRARAAA